MSPMLWNLQLVSSIEKTVLYVVCLFFKRLHLFLFHLKVFTTKKLDKQLIWLYNFILNKDVSCWGWQSGERSLSNPAIQVWFSRWEILLQLWQKIAQLWFFKFLWWTSKWTKRTILRSLGCVKGNVAQTNWSYDFGTHDIILIHYATQTQLNHTTSRWQLQLQTPAQERVDCKCPLRQS